MGGRFLEDIGRGIVLEPSRRTLTLERPIGVVYTLRDSIWDWRSIEILVFLPSNVDFFIWTQFLLGGGRILIWLWSWSGTLVSLRISSLVWWLCFCLRFWRSLTLSKFVFLFILEPNLPLNLSPCCIILLHRFIILTLRRGISLYIFIIL